MMHFPHSTGNDYAAPNGYILSVSSHKGGTGRTTIALALAWLWSQRGLKVGLIDADTSQAATLMAAGPDGKCRWKNVTLRQGIESLDSLAATSDVVLIDCPALTERAAQDVLSVSHGVLLTILPETLCLRTMPQATAAVRLARATNPRLRLAGMIVNQLEYEHPDQDRVMQILRTGSQSFMIEPAIPRQDSLRSWAAFPGSDLPDGLARNCLQTLARLLREQLQLSPKKPQLVGQV